MALAKVATRAAVRLAGSWRDKGKPHATFRPIGKKRAESADGFQMVRHAKFNVKPIASKMKKFISCMVLMMLAMSVSAMAQMKAYSPPEQDIGYEQVATLSLDGMTVAAFDSQFNIVDWQTPVMVAQEASTASAQVVDAYSVQTPMGEISMTLVAYMWPTNRNENANLRNDYTGNYAPDGDAYSFTSSRADFS